MKRIALIFTLFVLFAALLLLTNRSQAGDAEDHSAFLPHVQRSEPTPTPTPLPTPSPTPPPTESMVEFRGIWVSRFDWTLYDEPTLETIDEMVNNIAAAGFNAIFFQVRGEADAFYTPGLEPWSRRLTGTLGQNPGWDPLARLIERAKAHNIQVHAYINVYPIWTGCTPPPDGTNPRHVYYALRDAHGTDSGRLRGLMWNQNGDPFCAVYQRATPASFTYDEHILAVAADIINRYDVDGLHLDHIRFERGGTTDPVSAAAYAAVSDQYSYEGWQRRQVNGTVSKFYELAALDNNLWLSAAVWPLYVDYWGWGVSEGYHDYFQDSKEWIAQGYIDSISPMIYPATFNCPDDSFWTQARWRLLVENFHAGRNGRFVIPGIGGGYCSFAEIEARINMARELGTAGHAIFSYSGLAQNNYFDDLANGPYATPATVPQISWHP